MEILEERSLCEEILAEGWMICVDIPAHLLLILLLHTNVVEISTASVADSLTDLYHPPNHASQARNGGITLVNLLAVRNHQLNCMPCPQWVWVSLLQVYCRQLELASNMYRTRHTVHHLLEIIQKEPNLRDGIVRAQTCMLSCQGYFKMSEWLRPQQIASMAYGLRGSKFGVNDQGIYKQSTYSDKGIKLVQAETFGWI